MLYPDMVDIGVETLVNGLVEYLPEVSAVVAEERRDGLKLDIVLVIMVDIVDDIVQNTVTGRIARCIHYHFKLPREEQNDLIKIQLRLDKLDNGRIGREGNLLGAV